MAKKLGKVLLLSAAVGSAIGAICYYLKKKDAAQDVEEEEYDDFDNSEDKPCTKSSNYVPLNPEPTTDDAQASDSAEAKEDASDSFTPLAEHVAQAAEKAEETVEAFFDEEDSSDEEPPINDD